MFYNYCINVNVYSSTQHSCKISLTIQKVHTDSYFHFTWFIRANNIFPEQVAKIYILFQVMLWWVNQKKGGDWTWFITLAPFLTESTESLMRTIKMTGIKQSFQQYFWKQIPFLYFFHFFTSPDFISDIFQNGPFSRFSLTHMNYATIIIPYAQCYPIPYELISTAHLLI